MASPIGPLRLAIRAGAVVRLTFSDAASPAGWQRDELALAPASAQLRAHREFKLTSPPLVSSAAIGPGR